jgi:K+-sensing histidine kinase KdpD
MLYTSVSLIKMQMSTMTPEEIAKFMESAIRGTERLAEEVRNIVTYLDAPLSLNLGDPVKLEELPELVKTICARLQMSDVILSLPEDMRPTVISMTRDALEMIFYELLENSHKFHPTHSPHVEISVGRTKDGFISMRIADDGINLSAEQLDWAWLPYFQSEKDFTGEIPGTGLGFPMVATLIWRAGGNLWLRNRQDSSGVVVDLKIPLEITMRNMQRSALPYKPL